MDIELVVVPSRIRKDLGNIDELANSIREFGIIQPIVLYEDSLELCAGGRRLTALKRLGIKELVHGTHFIWRSEEDAYRRKATELEENLKRKELSWQEQVSAKAQLLELMQSIHGVAQSGGRTRQELATGQTDGFGIRSLASMLGESVGLTSKDIQIANAIKALPQLRGADTKEGALRQLSILGAVAGMVKNAAQAKAANPTALPWILYEGDFRANVDKIADETVDLVYSDLPFGVALDASSKHDHGTVGYTDSRQSVVDILGDLAKCTFRVLRPDRFAVFYFGFNYYGELVGALERAGLQVNPVPVVWYKHTRTTENPNKRYANAYDAALVAMKGSPVFIRPGQTNVVDIPAITPGNKLQIAQQPIELVKRFIADMTAEGAYIVDFTAGSGTTGVAALELKRRVTLFERESQACLLIKARLGAMK